MTTKQIRDAIEYDSVIGCYTFEFDGEIICLGAETMEDAIEEAKYITIE